MKALLAKSVRQSVGLPLVVACLACCFLSWHPCCALGVGIPMPPSPAEVPHSFPESGKAWENSLGMKFVPVPGTQVLFSIWDTREQDYLAFLADEHPDWDLPANPQSRMCPVVKVSWQDATDFCGWLTEKERLEGRLDKDQGYRLPTDAEWSRAVGLPEESGSTPEEKSGKIKDIYPWGKEWPPPRKAGNYSSQAIKDDLSKKGVQAGQAPVFAPVLPVASFAPNRYGLYDMGGNVWQWCDDWYDESGKLRVLRGASALVTGPDFLLSSVRGYDPPGVLHPYNGFRCVLSFDASAPKAPERAAAPRPIPIFRLEPGMHTAPIRRVSVDAAGSLALTVSQDKTARLWELPSGRLLRVLNPPQDKVSEGELSAAALSPDGTLAAVGGGQTGFEWDKSDSVYIFNTATGRLVWRLPGLPEMIPDLAFSAQGRFLAAVAGDGLRVWEMATGKEVGQDKDYGGEFSNSVDWHGEERLVTTCLDGQLRLYQLAAGPGESQLTLLKKRAPRGGSKRLCDARFSPDGRLIAVGFEIDFGFNFSKAVIVVDGSDLAFRFAPDTAGVKTGNLGSIAWTDDGANLTAGGTWQSNDGILIRRWPELGRGHPSDAVSTRNTVLDLKPLPGGRILFGTADPAWGVLASNGQRQLLVSPPIANYSGLLEGLQLSDDGTTVSFAYEGLGQAPARFALPGRKLTLLDDAGAASGLHPPLTEGLPVTYWKNSTGTKLFGQPIPLSPLEASRSLAIAADARFLLLGTDLNLWSIWTWGRATPWITKKFEHPTLFGQRWRVPAPGQVCAVNLADGDRLAVAAYADGTIRWHRADNGKELLAFFPHADRKRWVLWTPEGYYDASAGAEDLIGWHLNRGKDQAADFFPASRFRAVYYRPDVISRVLKTLDNTEALRQANAALGRAVAGPESTQEVIARLSPPVVELATGGVLGEVTIPKDARSVAVRYLVRQTGEEAPTKVSVRLNGRPVDVTAPLLPEGQEASVEVPLPSGAEGEVSIIAEHRYGASEAAILRVRRDGGAIPLRRPDLYVIACGLLIWRPTNGERGARIVESLLATKAAKPWKWR
jgi:WD40 repeat protein